MTAPVTRFSRTALYRAMQRDDDYPDPRARSVRKRATRRMVRKATPQESGK
jgi:hypothetical protein